MTRTDLDKPGIDTPQRLFDNEVSRFLEEALNTIENLRLVVDNANSIIGNKEELEKKAFDYMFIFHLQKLMAQVRSGTLSLGALDEILERRLEEFKTNNPEFARLIDKELMQLIRKHGLARERGIGVLQKISGDINDLGKLEKDIASLLHIVELLEDEKLKANIRNRLTLIKRYMGEIESLNYALRDVNDWSQHVHFDVLFFTDRTRSYFEEDVKTPDGKLLKGLDTFNKDQILRKAVFGSREVQMLYYVARFTHKVAEQIGFISRLISMLQRDIQTDKFGKSKWMRAEATEEFCKHIEEYAATFRTEYADNPFASYLLKNKERIGQQPLKWITILNGWRGRLEELMRRKNAVIGDAGKYLAAVFEKRSGLLRDAIARLILQINRAIMAESGEINLVSAVQKGIDALKRDVDRLWKNRKKRFIYTYDRVDVMYMDIAEHFEKLEEMFDIEAEAEQLATQGGSIVKFSEHKEKVLEAVNILDPAKFSYLLMLDFDFARLGEFHNQFGDFIEQIKQKDNALSNYDLTLIRKGVQRMINAYLTLVNWSKQRILLEDVGYVTERTSKFMSERYG